MNESWFSSQGLALTFWGEDWMGVLGGLLIKKPLFFDNYVTGVLYREFLSMDDIRKTQNVLNHVIVCDFLLSSAAVDLESSTEQGYLSYKNLLLTLWVKNRLGIPANLAPLSLDELKEFYPRLWEPGKKPHRISESIKTDFLDFLSDRTGLSTPVIFKKARPFLENFFEDLESEYGDVSVDALDPKYVTLFLLEKPNL